MANFGLTHNDIAVTHNDLSNVASDTCSSQSTYAICSSHYITRNAKMSLVARSVANDACKSMLQRKPNSIANFLHSFQSQWQFLIVSLIEAVQGGSTRCPTLVKMKTKQNIIRYSPLYRLSCCSIVYVRLRYNRCSKQVFCYIGNSNRPTLTFCAKSAATVGTDDTAVIITRLCDNRIANTERRNRVHVCGVWCVFSDVSALTYFLFH